MKFKPILALASLAFLTGCRFYIWGETATAATPPGWRSLVSELLVEDSAFPEGWARMRDSPKGSLTDPTINHVYRSWWDQKQGAGKAEQAIWRAYTVRDAEKLAMDLLQNPLFSTAYTPSPYDEPYSEFRIPSEISFQNPSADEFFLACGRLNWAYCEVVARYRNYVTDMRLDLKTEYEGHISRGLTYAEIETIVRAMDAKFAEFLAAHPLLTPTP